MQQPFVPAHWSPRLQRQGSARSASSSASARPYRSAPWSRGPRLGANTATSWNASAAPVLGPLDIDFGSALAPGHVAGAWEEPAWTPPGDRSWGQLVQPAAGTAGEAAGYPHKTGLKRARGQYEDFLADEALRFGSSTGEDGDGDDNGDGDDSSSPSGGEDAEDCESNEDGEALSFRTRALALLESLPENALSAQHAGNLLSLGREHAGARHQTQTVFTERPLVGAVPWAVYCEANACSRPYAAGQQNDRWRNSGGATGAKELFSSHGTVLRRYGAVHRGGGEKLRYHAYSFKHEADARFSGLRIFHTLANNRARRLRPPGAGAVRAGAVRAATARGVRADSAVASAAPEANLAPPNQPLVSPIDWMQPEPQFLYCGESAWSDSLPPPPG